ncbi:glycosyltransferase family 2 protein [Rhodovulum tesquicola]|uniref:Glycosyl transferase family 2 n=1 Tax=Rhodovulum steppense TaxID=540251 RepID=A0A4R1YX18_9RHOB|nr:MULTISPECIES: glycosyltransferase family A protein [Rhodovulum]MCO8146835.1 glycosyltransferase family 2 protein [Rhodovulum tesquicola]TCM85526.1 glycosyl transferase family 2 [Rhodovulum steppense]
MPGISCIIPAWNAAAFIEEAIDSVASQDRQVDELIVVDDGSTDDTAALVSARPGVRLLQQANAGVAAARNAGLAAATGDFVAFLDADDLWTPRKLSLQMSAFLADPELALCFGGAEHLDIRPVGFQASPLALPSGPEAGRLMAGLLAPRRVFERVGPFDATMTTGADQEWLLRARGMGLKEVILPEIVLVRRIHGENLTLRRNDEKHHNFMMLLAKQIRARRQAGSMSGCVETWKADDDDR